MPASRDGIERVGALVDAGANRPDDLGTAVGQPVARRRRLRDEGADESIEVIGKLGGAVDVDDVVELGKRQGQPLFLSVLRRVREREQDLEARPVAERTDRVDDALIDVRLVWWVYFRDVLAAGFGDELSGRLENAVHDAIGGESVSGPVVANLLCVVVFLVGVGREDPVGRVGGVLDGEILPVDRVS